MKRETIEDQRSTEGLPVLFTRMADDLSELFDAKLALLRIEVREEMETYIRSGVMILIGSVVALVGFALLNVAIAFLVSTLFGSTNLSQPARYALGFAITALIYLVGGIAVIFVYKSKFAEQRLVPPRTVAELKRDKERLEREM